MEEKELMDYTQRQINKPAINKAKELVKDWRSHFNLPIGLYGEKPTKRDRELSYRLVVEEFEEYLTAVATKDYVEQVDALCDLFFVVVQMECVESGVFNNTKNNYVIKSLGEAVVNVLKQPLHKSNYLDCYHAIAKELGGEFLSAIREVYKSNMSKLCTTREEAEATKIKYLKEKIETYYKQNIVSGKYVVYRTSDRKVLKSVNFKEPQLREFSWVLKT